MKSWILSPIAGHSIHNSEKARVEGSGGLRYLWIDLGVQINSNENTVFDQIASAGFRDRIDRVRTRDNLNDTWFMPMSIDAGGGNSEGTLQGVAGIDDNFTKFNTSLTYRCLSFKFDDTPTMSKLAVKGPMLSMHFSFRPAV